MRLTIIASLALLAACGVPAPPPGAPEPAISVNNPVPTGTDNSCGGRRYGGLIGQDATVLERTLILGPVRVVRPGSVVTQELLPDRINFIIGAENRITQITCG